jgi:hypothetical protein
MKFVSKSLATDILEFKRDKGGFCLKLKPPFVYSLIVTG